MCICGSLQLHSKHTSLSIYPFPDVVSHLRRQDKCLEILDHGASTGSHLHKQNKSVYYSKKLHANHSKRKEYQICSSTNIWTAIDIVNRMNKVQRLKD
jgi:hypothetical protein